MKETGQDTWRKNHHEKTGGKKIILHLFPSQAGRIKPRPDFPIRLCRGYRQKQKRGIANRWGGNGHLVARRRSVRGRALSAFYRVANRVDLKRRSMVRTSPRGLELFFNLTLRERGDDRRACNHYCKCESNPNVMHDETP